VALERQPQPIAESAPVSVAVTAPEAGEVVKH
jgi:hypothetical protein